MKRKSQILKILIGAFVVFGILLISTNLMFAQCGNYFKTNYRAVNKVGGYPVTRDPTDDWTGDGKSDFWELRASGTGSGIDIAIYPSKATGYWDWDNPIIYRTSILDSGNLGYKVADFDSDGKMDLVYGSRIHHNTGNGSLIPLPLFSDSNGGVNNVETLDYADVNGDNLLDWIYTYLTPTGTELRYQLQTPNGSFSNQTTILADSPESSENSYRRLGDFNGDGKIDIFYNKTSNFGITNKSVLIKNLGGGNFQVGPSVVSDIYLTGSVRDFNNDGKADIVFYKSDSLVILYGQADGTFNRVQIPGSNGFTYPAELNGDNNSDIIQIDTNSYATYINNGAGVFSQTVYQKSLATRFDSFILEDFSGDGKADLYIITDRFNPIINYNIFGERLLTIDQNICQSFGETKQANLDGNQNADVVMWNPTTGNFSSKNARWGSAGVDPTTRVFNWGLGTFGDVPALGDFDGDGKTDYSVYRNSIGVWYIFRSFDSTWLVFKFGLTGDIAVPNDYNGGGKTDIAVFRPSDGNWYIWFSETQQFQALHFGANGDKPVPADYDGDGKTDVAVYRPSEGNWYYYKSSDGNISITHWGIATDKPIPADYDGDGRADLTISRNGIAWLLRSSNNSYSAIGWGTANDIFMPVYRNSVSADLIRYNPSNNLWYSFDFRNVAGFALGGSQDIPVYFGLPNN